MKVYKYGITSDLDDQITAQMKAGHDYYNQLVEAENRRRYDLWFGGATPAPPHTGCSCKDCRDHYRNLTPPKPPHTPCTQKPCTACNAFWQPFNDASWLDLKPLRKQRPDGLYWGTYLLIERAFMQAVKTTKILDRVRFRPYRRSSTVCGVQIQKNKRLDAFFQIEARHDSRKGKRKGRRHRFRLRVGSQGRTPIWSDWINIELHRPWSGDIKWIAVVRAANGKCSLQITCNNENARTDNAAHGAVAVDISWRKLQNGSWRLAMARDLNGNLDELTLPPEWAELSARADRIRGHRDKRLNELAAVDSRFAVCKHPSGVERRARKLGIDQGDAIWDWVARDRHLDQYEAGCRRRSIARRRNDMRVWVRQLRRNYATVIIKDTSHKKLKEKKDLHQGARRQGQRAAPGEIVEQLRRVFGKGMQLVPAPMTNHVLCGPGHRAVEVGADLMLVCERCGARHDRDHVSTQNMLALWSAGEGVDPPARRTGGRFANQHGSSASP